VGDIMETLSILFWIILLSIVAYLIRYSTKIGADLQRLTDPAYVVPKKKHIRVWDVGTAGLGHISLYGEWCGIREDPPVTRVYGTKVFKPVVGDRLRIPMESERVAIGVFQRVWTAPSDGCAKFYADVRILGYEDELEGE